jgi:hypothetical protein
MVSANENLLESGHLLALQFNPIKTTSHYKKNNASKLFFQTFFSFVFFFKFPNTCVVFFFSPSVLQLPAGEEVTKVTRQVRN